VSRRPAVARTAPPWLLVALAATAVAVGHGFGRMSYPFVLPAMVDDVLGSFSRAGLLGMANLGAYLVGILVVIRLAGRVPLADFVKVGLVGVTAGLALLVVAPGFPLLLLAMAMTGGFNAAIWVPASALAASAVGPRHRGLATGALGMGYGLAIVFAGQVTRELGTADGRWRTVWAVQAVVGVLVLLAVVWRLPRVRIEVPVRGGVGFGALRSLPGWGPLVVSYAGFALGYVVFSSYLVAAVEDAGFSPATAANAYSLVGVTGIVGGLIVGRLSDLLDRRRVLLGAHLLMAACAAAVLLESSPAASAAAAVFGIFASGLPAVVSAYVADHLDPVRVAAAFGVVTIAFGVAQTAGPPLGGLLADATGGFAWTFTLAAGAHLVGAVAALLLPRPRTPAATTSP
jgi:predicted MFS family arabinose efflux permease